MLLLVPGLHRLLSATRIRALENRRMAGLLGQRRRRDGGAVNRRATLHAFLDLAVILAGIALLDWLLRALTRG